MTGWSMSSVACCLARWEWLDRRLNPRWNGAGACPSLCLWSSFLTPAKAVLTSAQYSACGIFEAKPVVRGCPHPLPGRPAAIEALLQPAPEAHCFLLRGRGAGGQCLAKETTWPWLRPAFRFRPQVETQRPQQGSWTEESSTLQSARPQVLAPGTEQMRATSGSRSANGAKPGSKPAAHGCDGSSIPLLELMQRSWTMCPLL
mmetsp:Transcript_20327/g.48219  ORF Transcript_20327/g.48219 Transcript_20327/m.48219 type:complete len:202 (+) Transcript_20327:189-794(+)